MDRTDTDSREPRPARGIRARRTTTERLLIGDNMTMYTRRHYEDMARFITAIKTSLDSDSIALLADTLSVRFKSDNPRFDTDKWYKAIGITKI